MCFKVLPNAMLSCHHNRSGTWNIHVKTNTKGRTVAIFIYSILKYGNSTPYLYMLHWWQCFGLDSKTVILFSTWWKVMKDGKKWRCDCSFGEYLQFWWLSSILWKGIKVKSVPLCTDYFGLNLALWYEYML